jgi:hypothetical protein
VASGSIASYSAVFFKDGGAEAGPTPLTSQLTLQIAGVGADDLERGVSAARDVFRAHGIAPAEADHGRWRRDLCEALGLAGDKMILSRRDALAACAWDQALRAAVTAACPGSSVMSCPEAQLRLSPPLTQIAAVEIGY